MTSRALAKHIIGAQVDADGAAVCAELLSGCRVASPRAVAGAAGAVAVQVRAIGVFGALDERDRGGVRRVGVYRAAATSNNQEQANA